MYMHVVPIPVGDMVKYMYMYVGDIVDGRIVTTCKTHSTGGVGSYQVLVPGISLAQWLQRDRKI